LLKKNKIESIQNFTSGDISNLLLFFNSSPDLLFVFDPDGIIMEVNETAAEKLQYESKELSGQSIYNLHPAEMRDDAEKFFNEILEGKRSDCPLPFITKKGELLYVETQISRGEWNGKDAMFSVSKDITARRQAEEIARQNEERYKILFSNINDAVFVHEFTDDGLPGKFFEVNDIACKRLGYTREELLTMSPKDIDAPEGYALVPEMMKNLQLQKHTVWEGIHVTKTGVKIPVEISNHLFSMEGKPVILATVRDITERKRSEELLRKSEEKYRKIFENIQDIFYQADTEGTITDISPSIERYSGYKPEELIGMKIEDVYLNPADRNDLLQILLSKGQIEDYIIKLRTKDLREVFVSANIHLLFGPDGKPTGVEGSLRDVSERITAQEKVEASEKLLRRQNEEYIILNEEIRIAKEKAEESDRLKSAFLANMSHEIRTPMNGIVGFSTMLADPKLLKETRDAYLKIVNSSCDQLLHIVNDIIDISKIEAGQIDLSETSFDLRELFGEISSFYSTTAREKGVELIIKPFSGTLSEKYHIISDRTKLRQVLDNLLSNAVKFTESGKITIKCELVNNSLQFEIEDTGIGIPPELREVVFERFRQVETSYTKKYGGTGLGLSITKAYVEKIGGEIWLSSELGKGSTFSFRIPYKPVVEGEISEETVLKPSQNNHIKENLTVLIVEDEEINWMFLNEILKKKVTTIHAVNGKSAIEHLQKHPEISIVLMDIKLPDINGLDLTKMIKTINSEIVVIAQTAFALAGDREKAIEAGCNDYITKPVKREDLLNLISMYSG
jgi:PAS domain S-box-containing protein